MKKLALFVTLGVFALMSFISNTPTPKNDAIKFESSWNQAVALAKKENKLIYLNIYATWCGPCKRLKRKTFTDESVGAYYNSNFINISLDGEKEEGIQLSKKYNTDSYPMHLFVNADGKLIVKKSGYHNSSNFIKMGKEVISK